MSGISVSLRFGLEPLLRRKRAASPFLVWDFSRRYATEVSPGDVVPRSELLGYFRAVPCGTGRGGFMLPSAEATGRPLLASFSIVLAGRSEELFGVH